MSTELDYRSLPEEDLEKLDRALVVSLGIMTEGDGEDAVLRDQIQAAEERAAKTFMVLTEKRMLIAQIRAERSAGEDLSAGRRRKITSLKRSNTRQKRRIVELKATVQELLSETRRLNERVYELEVEALLADDVSRETAQLEIVG